MTQVEKAPTVVKAGLKKEEAEELKKKLEAGTEALAHTDAHTAEALLNLQMAEACHCLQAHAGLCYWRSANYQTCRSSCVTCPPHVQLEERWSWSDQECKVSCEDVLRHAASRFSCSHAWRPCMAMLPSLVGHPV